MIDLVGYRRIHLIGAGGAGMSALAKILAKAGSTVTGSDLHPGAALDRLDDLGIEVWSGHRPERMVELDLVVASSAIPEHDPEWEAAGRAGILRWHRPQLLAAITSRIDTIGATGTHGKSSTSAMMVTALRGLGLAPSFVVGADLVDMGTNASFGNDRLLILEADEAFGTFEHLFLKGLVVTSVEADHLDHFGSMDEVEAAFTRVVRKVEGPVVVGVDDPGAARLAQRTSSMTYGTDNHADFRMIDPVIVGDGMAFGLRGPDFEVTVRIHRPGLHMARNAAGVVALGSQLGYDPRLLAVAIERFRGIRRRFENRGTIGGVTFIDDYAHHPTEVKATLRAARQLRPSRLVALFQPHLYSRTQAFSGEFGAALTLADVVLVTDVYGAREQPMPGVSGQLVAAAAIRSGNQRTEYIAHRAEVVRRLLEVVEPGDMVVVMGAGDITTAIGETIQMMSGYASA